MSAEAPTTRDLLKAPTRKASLSTTTARPNQLQTHLPVLATKGPRSAPTAVKALATAHPGERLPGRWERWTPSQPWPRPLKKGPAPLKLLQQ
eukprot:12817381-Alexandrium_andersonii.AAC.1